MTFDGHKKLILETLGLRAMKKGELRVACGVSKRAATGGWNECLALLVEDRIVVYNDMTGTYRARKGSGTHAACSRKLRWATQSKAAEFRDLDDKQKDIKTRVYLCELCAGWHRTSQALGLST